MSFGSPLQILCKEFTLSSQVKTLTFKSSLNFFSKCWSVSVQGQRGHSNVVDIFWSIVDKKTLGLWYWLYCEQLFECRALELLLKVNCWGSCCKLWHSAFKGAPFLLLSRIAGSSSSAWGWCLGFISQKLASKCAFSHSKHRVEMAEATMS